MEEKRKYRCLLCGRIFYADPEEMQHAEMTLCDPCREAGSLGASSEAEAMKNELIAHAMRTGANLANSIAGSRLNRDDSMLEEDFDDAFPGYPDVDRFVRRSRNPVDSYMDDDYSFSRRESFFNKAGKAIDEFGQIVDRFRSVKQPAYGQESRSSIPDDWICIGNLYDAYTSGALRQYNRYIGLYMHTINGEIKYIGKAVEYNNGGFRKRLSDYCRPNNSARTHTSGQIIFAHKEQITTYILIVGSDAEAKRKTEMLEIEYIRKFNPPWNDQHADH